MEELIKISVCPVCKSSEFTLDLKSGIFELRECKNCGLIYISPRVADLNVIYTDNSSSSPSSYYEHSKEKDNRVFTERLNILEKFAHKGRLLDIGCSVGTLPQIAETRGWNASGIEPNPVSADICRKKGLNVTEGFFNSKLADELRGNFEAVYLGDVIEHLNDPSDTIENILKVLKPNGILMIVTPDYDSTVAKQFQIKPKEHILYFTESSLKNLLLRFNVKIELLKKTTRERSMKAMAHSTTFTGRPFMKRAVSILAATGLDPVINFAIRLLVKDELLVIVRKQ